MIDISTRLNSKDLYHVFAFSADGGIHLNSFNTLADCNNYVQELEDVQFHTVIYGKTIIDTFEDEEEE